MNEHLKKHQFKPGQSGNPKGRIAPTGRQQMLTEMERWFAENKEKFVKKLGQAAFARPIAFVRDVYIPLLSKDMLITHKDADGKTAIWHCLTEMGVSASNADEMVQTAIDVESKEATDSDNHKMPFIPNASCCPLK